MSNNWLSTNPPNDGTVFWGIHPDRGVRKFKYDPTEGFLYLLDRWYRTSKPEKWKSLNDWPNKSH